MGEKGFNNRMNSEDAGGTAFERDSDFDFSVKNLHWIVLRIEKNTRRWSKISRGLLSMARGTIVGGRAVNWLEGMVMVNGGGGTTARRKGTRMWR